MQCDAQCWSAVGSVLSGIATSGAILVAYFQLRKVAQQTRETHEWNRRKASQEVLGVLVLGEFPDLRSKLEHDMKCDISDADQTYDKRIAGLSEADKLKLDVTLARVLNILETIAINIKHNIIDEDICYDYLGWIMVEYFRWSRGFIEVRRAKAGDPRVLACFAEFATKWSERMLHEKRNIAASGKVPAKPAL